MSTTTLRVKRAPGFRVDASALAPDALAALALADVERIVLPAGNERCTVGDLFDVTRTDAPLASTRAAPGGETGATPHANALVVDGADAWLDCAGARMESGHLLLRGRAGDYAGLQMRGGTLVIEGDAGRHAGSGMRGGRLAVRGDCGDFAAGALPGDMEGMTGGTLAIGGCAGARLGDRMRRGLVLVGGDAGPYAASRLVAGTVAIAGDPGLHVGYGMRRGTLLLARAPAALPPTFAEGGRGFDVFWALFARHLAAHAPDTPFAAWRDPPRVRYTGDLAVDGRGEILIAR